MRTTTAENQTLASILYAVDVEVSRGLALEMISEINEEHFSDIKNKEIFKRIAINIKSGCGIGAMDIVHDLREDAQCVVYDLATHSTTNNLKRCLTVLKQGYETRLLINACHYVLSNLTENPTSSKLELSKQAIAKAVMRQDNKVSDEGFLKDYLPEYFDKTQKLMSGDEEVGVPFGIPSLDVITGGCVKGDLVGIAGRSGMGKSSFASGMMVHQLLKGYKPLLVSMELGRKEIVDKIISMVSSITEGRTIPFMQINKPRGGFGGAGLLSDDLQRMGQIANDFLNVSQMYLRGSSRITVEEIMAKARKLIAEDSCDIIYVDHIGLLVQNKDNATAELTHITNSLKLFASEMEIPVVIVIQLNRGADTVSDVPKLSHLKGSGSIEEDCSLVIFPWRPNAIDNRIDPSECDIICAKSRNSGTGTIKGYFDTTTTMFREATEADGGVVTEKECKF